MEPIISPWLIYACDLVYSLHWLIFILLMGIIVFAIFFSFTEDEVIQDQIRKKKLVKRAVIAGILLLLVGVFLPSQETMYKMIVASYITPDNLSAVNEVMKHTVEEYAKILLSR